MVHHRIEFKKSAIDTGFLHRAKIRVEKTRRQNLSAALDKKNSAALDRATVFAVPVHASLSGDAVFFPAL
jgi:hypothetical protein